MAYFQRYVVNGIERIGRSDKADPDFPIEAPWDASEEVIRNLALKTPGLPQEMLVGLVGEDRSH